MPHFIDYLLKVSLGLILVFLFYKLILSRHTFYTWNRWCLLIYSSLAFVIPLMDITPAIKEGSTIPSSIVEAVPTLPKIEDLAPIMGSREAMSKESVEISSFPLVGIWDIVFYIFLAGCLFRVIQVCAQLYAFKRIKRRSKLTFKEGISIYHLQENILPFSFWKSIFLNQEGYSEEDRHKIILHELVHVNQLHSVDIMFAELLCTVCWFNPAVWFIRRAIRENLEYIADREVIQNGSEAREYQYLLLKVSGNHMTGMANHFTFSSLKTRILMMNKARSTRIHLIKFVFTLPLICFLLVAFREHGAQFPSILSSNGNKTSGSSRAIICGILRDSESGKPLSGYEIKISLDTQSVFFGRVLILNKDAKPIDIAVIETDEDGFYYWDNRDTSLLKFKNASFQYHFESEDYNGFGGSIWFENIKEHVSVGGVSYLVKKSAKDGFHDGYRDESLASHSTDSRENSRQVLMSLLPIWQKEHKLKLDFRKAYKDPSQIITKFEGRYFDQKREMIGYVGEMQFYIDGKEVTYDKVNYNFRFRQPHLTNSNRVEIRERYATKMYYYTSDTYRDAPPSSIVKSKNVEWVDVSKFDMSLLEKESYYLDGFWQVNGVGSNMKPERNEIKRIALLKGKLARYYNKNFEKLWWIETRPADEVVGRPDFAQL